MRGIIRERETSIEILENRAAVLVANQSSVMNGCETMLEVQTDSNHDESQRSQLMRAAEDFVRENSEGVNNPIRGYRDSTTSEIKQE